MMKMFMAATALAGLIGVPAQANAGCGCSGGAQSPVATNAPIASHYAGGGYQAAPPIYQSAPSQYGLSGYSAAPPYSNAPNNYSAPLTAMPVSPRATTPSSYPTARSLATTPFADATPSCCADGGSSCCADGGSSCCRGKAGEVPTTLPTTMQLSTSGNALWLTQPLSPRSSQTPPMPMSSAAPAPAPNSAPVAVDPHAGHQH